jgi:hypothetical protein
VHLRLDGPIYDLADVSQRQEIEERHLDLLIEHDMRHLDLHEITTNRRVVTQAIAGDLYNQGVSAIRFPSCLDGNTCIAVFEGRGNLELAGEIVRLTDPPPAALLAVATPWHFEIESAPPDHAQ